MRPLKRVDAVVDSRRAQPRPRALVEITKMFPKAFFPRSYFTRPYFTGKLSPEVAPPPQFADDFEIGSPLPGWTVRGGTWTISSGILSQRSSNFGDPKKLLLTSGSYGSNLTLRAKMRVDQWIRGDAARAGLGVRTDVATGFGYNLLFRNVSGTPNVQFLDDQVRWGQAFPFAWQMGTWYWMMLQVDGSTLRGKLWADGATEPPTWPFVQTGWTNRPGGVPAINGSSTSTSNAEVSFDSFEVL